jgi:tetratricopeptide (TPR) repeat protein
MERRTNYISFWKGMQEPYLVIDPHKGRGGTINVSSFIHVKKLPACRVSCKAMEKPALFRAFSPDPPWKSRSTSSAETHFNRGKKMEEDLRGEDAIHEYCTALSLSPEYLQPAKALIRLYNEGTGKNAIYHFFDERACSLPCEPLFWYARGELQRERGNYSLADDALRKAESTGFITTELYLARMKLYARTKEIDSFETSLHACLALDRKCYEAYRCAMLFYQDLEKWDRCISVASSGRKYFPASAIFPAMEGFAQLNRGNKTKALALVEEAIRKDPSMGWYHCIRGWVLLKMGDRTAAQQEIENGIELKSGVENPGFFKNLLTSPSE